MFKYKQLILLMEVFQVLEEKSKTHPNICKFWKKYLLNKFDRYVILIFVLLPSYNFWTSGISKDVITALALSLMLLSFSKNNFKFIKKHQ